MGSSNRNKNKLKGKQPEPAMSQDTPASASADLESSANAQRHVHFDTPETADQQPAEKIGWEDGNEYPLNRYPDIDNEILPTPPVMNAILDRGNEQEILLALALVARNLSGPNLRLRIERVIDLEGMLSRLESGQPALVTSESGNSASVPAAPPHPHPADHPGEMYGYGIHDECGCPMVPHLPGDCARATTVIGFYHTLHGHMHITEKRLESEITGKNKGISTLQTNLARANGEIESLSKAVGNAGKEIQKEKDGKNAEKRKVVGLKAKIAGLEADLVKALGAKKRAEERIEREDLEGEVFFEKQAEAANAALKHLKDKKDKKIEERKEREEREKAEKLKLEKQKEQK